MWYFTWILGLAFACTFGVLNAMWLEVKEQQEELKQNASTKNDQD